LFGDGKLPEAGKIDPLGEGLHTFDVYFNREMDRDKPPLLTFGVREPYTQNVVQTSASWSEDGKIWTATYRFDKYTGDGINYIRVSDAQDLEYFEIPIEDSRFSFVIDAAGSASSIFTAKEGTFGGVDLLWEEVPADRPIGYNLYRFENLTDTTYSDTIKVNEIVLTDIEFNDTSVEPYKRYYYMYTSINEDFKESSFSKVVSAVPTEVNSVASAIVPDFSILGVYPNPMVDYSVGLDLEIYQPGEYVLRIIDIFGNELHNEVSTFNFGRNRFVINPSISSSGIYLIQVSNDKYFANTKINVLR